MEGLSVWIVKRRRVLVVLFAIVLAASLVGQRWVTTNFEMSKYLSADMPSVESLNAVKKAFGVPSSVRVMTSKVGLVEAAGLKTSIEQVEGVDKVQWMDDLVNLKTPVSMMPEKVVNRYYKEGQALFYVYFDEGDFSPKTGAAIQTIRQLTGPEASIYGSASSNQEVINSTGSGTGTLGMILVPLMILVLLLSTTSWVEPFLFLFTLVVAIVINNGTNVFLGEVSFITQSMASALTLAISMDYAIFLLHRFGEEREKGLPMEAAMVSALNKSYGAIVSSAMTAIAGFLALLLMRFKIGTDLGLVFAKGISISLITILFLFPALAMLFSKVIDKTKHKSFMPSFKPLARGIYKFRGVTILIVCLLLVPAYLGQAHNAFVYGGSSISETAGSAQSQAKTTIEALYGPYNPTILMVPAGSPGRESELASKLEALPGVDQVQSMSTVVDDKLPQTVLPETLTSNFDSGDFRRMIVILNTPEESGATFETVKSVKALANTYYPKTYQYAGSSVSLYDIQSVADTDEQLVAWVSIALVALIILIAFRSVTLPVILVFAIEAAVFMNMSIPYFQGQPLTFIGMLVVSSLQLGSTIDYAILLTGRYLERRATESAAQAIVSAIDDAAGSILTSGTVLTLAGLILWQTSGVETISSMGLLIGRGTLLSLLMVFAFLPALLVVFDKVILKTTRQASKSAIQPAIQPEEEVYETL